LAFAIAFFTFLRNYLIYIYILLGIILPLFSSPFAIPKALLFGSSWKFHYFGMSADGGSSQLKGVLWAVIRWEIVCSLVGCLRHPRASQWVMGNVIVGSLIIHYLVSL
jgi:hypothetical protein